MNAAKNQGKLLFRGGGALFFGSKRINMWWGESTAP